jgi:hypothetical protein
VPVIEEEKEEEELVMAQVIPEESGLHAQISEVAPFSGIQNNDVTRIQRRDS